MVRGGWGTTNYKVIKNPLRGNAVTQGAEKSSCLSDVECVLAKAPGNGNTTLNVSTFVVYVGFFNTSVDFLFH